MIQNSIKPVPLIDTDCEYHYDSNGALTYDSNRGITSITYDYGHHPYKISMKAKKKTHYNCYTSDGRKLLSKHEGMIPTGTGYYRRFSTTDLYIDGLIVRDGVPYIWQFDGGYVELDTNGTPTSWNYYITDHLGSTRKVVDSNNNIKETISYYPFGCEMRIQDPALIQQTNSLGHPFRFTGKELDKQNGLNMYDFGARLFDVAGVPMWTSVDPLAEKYYHITPYSYCAGDPVNKVDPDGRSIKAESLSQANIINTVTPEEAEYIQFDENGLMNVDLINQCESTSDNFLSIKQLATSNTNYIFKVADKGHDGKAFYDNSSSGGNYYRGVTEMPGAQSAPSPDENVYIFVGACLSPKQQAMTTAHEAYAHGYLYDITGSVEAASHTYGSGVKMEWNEDYQMNIPVSVRIETNKTLVDRLNRVVNQAKNNYEKRIK